MRAIGRWSLVALFLNSIIGSGIFGLPSIVVKILGPASPWACVAGAGVIGVIMACFAEVGSQFREAGGPYLYTREAFGRLMGMEIAWLSWLTRLAGAAANASLFVIYLAGFWPLAAERMPRAALLAALIGLLAFLNVRGVSAGANLSNIFAVAKILPLVLFVAVGVFWMFSAQHSSFSVEPGMAEPHRAGPWLDAVLVLIYAYGGFETALYPTGELKEPRRDIPFGLGASLAVTALLYTLIQVVVVAAPANAADSERPLAAAAGHMLGPAGAAFITVAALVSLYGYLSAVTLSVPRLTYALAEQGDFPAPFARVHARFRTPYVSILVFAAIAWVLAVAASFEWNVVVSAVARLFTYGATCAALVVFRRRLTAQRMSGGEDPSLRSRAGTAAPTSGEAFRLPLGPAIAVLGVALTAALISRMGRAELVAILLTTAVALVNWLLVRRNQTPKTPL